MRRLTRRETLLAISQLALASTLAACGDGSPPTAAPAATQQATQAAPESDLELLAAAAYDLFPFATLTPALYVQVGERLLQADNPSVAAGLQQLRAAAAGTSWRDLDEAQRVATLTALQATPFFAALRASTIEVLYRAPETFALVGYGGSAIEYGGYLHRGFDEIDWLPVAP